MMGRAYLAENDHRHHPTLAPLAFRVAVHTPGTLEKQAFRDERISRQSPNHFVCQFERVICTLMTPDFSGKIRFDCSLPEFGNAGV